MRYLNDTYRSLEGRLKAEGFKVRVIKVLKAWEDSAIYTRDFLHKLHNAFLGLEEVSFLFHTCFTYEKILLLFLFFVRLQMIVQKMIQD